MFSKKNAILLLSIKQKGEVAYSLGDIYVLWNLNETVVPQIRTNDPKQDSFTQVIFHTLFFFFNPFTHLKSWPSTKDQKVIERKNSFHKYTRWLVADIHTETYVLQQFCILLSMDCVWQSQWILLWALVHLHLKADEDPNCAAQKTILQLIQLLAMKARLTKHHAHYLHPQGFLDLYIRLSH